MNKILSILLCITFAVMCIAILFAVHYKQESKSQKEQICSLTANVNLLIEGRKKDYADKTEIAKRNEELEEKARMDSSCFTWTDNIESSYVVQKLRND